MTKLDVINSTLKNIRWSDSKSGLCECPGKHLHSTKDGNKDCKFWVEPIPTISCFHEKCKNVLSSINRKIRAMCFSIARGENPNVIPGKDRPLTPEEIESIKKVKEKKKWEALARGTKLSLPTKYAWSERQVYLDSPRFIAPRKKDQYHAFLDLFGDKDVIWIGDVTDSSSTDPRFQENFKSISEWRRRDEPIGNYTCPSVFQFGVHSRSNTNVITRPFLVIESDVLSRNEICSVFRWCRDFMELRMIVDTGGKSLHGWFTWPGAEIIDRLKIILPILDCDPALFKPSQPVRIPGAFRVEKAHYQTILWMGRNV